MDQKRTHSVISGIYCCYFCTEENKAQHTAETWPDFSPAHCRVYKNLHWTMHRGLGNNTKQNSQSSLITEATWLQRSKLMNRLSPAALRRLRTMMNPWRVTTKTMRWLEKTKGKWFQFSRFDYVWHIERSLVTFIFSNEDVRVCAYIVYCIAWCCSW